MFELSVKTHFSAAHRLVGYDGACANPHGHNWDVEIFIRGSDLNDLGMLIDYRDIKVAIREVMREIDHVDLNQVPVFIRTNPTSENLARYVYERLGERINDRRARVSRVTICETPGTSASYWCEDSGR